MFSTIFAGDKARREDGEYGRLDEEAGRYESCGTYGHSLP